uniref:NADH-ubiquinone oxidoreductase chain 5 n=1 Tax=Sphenophorus sp. BYU-CO246 TaxID=696090 RepID=D8WKL8_9CUCU|nr:NADH dehydrogenase subunit 5 [Sphenophorus sp. BYU-CO246]ACZ58551.1 NADH dehydrogenase subunit 5 [Sphenophorus sp. BYU-CO246]
MSICKIYFYFFMFLSINFFFLSLFFLTLEKSFFLELNLMSFNSTSIVYVVFLDWMATLFMSFVLLISGVVTKYSEEYMKQEKFLVRFILLVVMFVLSMMFLIISPNLISILLGWDGLGLVSYILVIFYQNVKSYNAGMLTALSNRIGDVALLMAISWMINYGSWNFMFYLEFYSEDYMMKWIFNFVVLAAFTKSAQIPFSSWLPAAMAAPTPVSSLVHSSTLVTAGVFLLIRFNIGFSESLNKFILLISLLTMFMSGMGANLEYDLKKIIALSTLSQLGLMMTILALGDSKFAFFHLLTHALFKALLFMCAGSIIHNLNNCQDIRFMGGLSKIMPLTCIYFNICNLSLCGFPFLAGFYSKDLIVEIFSMGEFNFFVYIIFYISIGLTASYSFRLLFYTVSGGFNYISLFSLSDQSKIMLSSMGKLIFLVVFMGSILMWLIFPTPFFICLSFTMKIMTLVMIILGGWIGYICAKINLSEVKNMSFFKSFLSNMWNLPVLSTYGINFFPLYSAKIYTKTLDQGWMEFYGSQGLYKGLSILSKWIQLFSMNHVKIYFILIFMFILFMFCLMI